MMIGTSVSAQQMTRTTVVATGAPMSEEMMQVQVQKMCRDLSLDQKQIDRVRRESRRIVRQREKMAETYRRSAAQVQQVLTPDQFAMWQKVMMPAQGPARMYEVNRDVLMRRNAERYEGPKGPKCQTGDCPRGERRRGHRHHRRMVQTDNMQTAVDILPAE